MRPLYFLFILLVCHTTVQAQETINSQATLTPKTMDNQALITKFYTSFANGNAEGMIDCYHDDIVFEDPAFGQLKGKDAKNMWRMLLSSDSETKIEFRDVQATEKGGSAKWRAEYDFGPKKRKVINNVAATFVFKEGKIIQHTDDFNMWKWTKQALGFSGHLLGWSPFMKKQIQKQTNGMLKKYSKNQ